MPEEVTNASETVKEWLIEMLDEKIEDANGTIQNERIWANGSPDAESASGHEANIRLNEEYIYALDAIKNAIKGE